MKLFDYCIVILLYLNGNSFGMMIFLFNAKSYPLILETGSEVHKSSHNQTEKEYCSRGMRDMADNSKRVEEEKPNYKRIERDL